MPDLIAQTAVFPERRDWLRLRTLISLRWMAIIGQLAALWAAWGFLKLEIPLGLCTLAVGAAIIGNLVAIFIFPQNRRLAETESLAILLFDLMQLSFLLYLTGGLSNPFALLILAPVTVSASALALRSTIFLGALAIIAVTVIGFFNVPLHSAAGAIVLPALFLFGFWLSLIIGILFLGLYSWRIATEMRSMSDALFATQMALAREQKLTDLGGVVAAAAHELGTPLATIKLVSAELMDELADRPDLLDDAKLIRQQADRCRDILHSMGKAGKDDRHLHRAPLEAVLREAAEPHVARGKEVIFIVHSPKDNAGPIIQRRPELIHGLRNLVQNAVDFAQSRVWVEADIDASRIVLRIIDDGAGFPSQVIGRIGDPFVRSRRNGYQPNRPEYEGMGLGLFIAKTLLERTGAELSFANAADPVLPDAQKPQRRGAIVEVVWPTAAILAPEDAGLGENQLIL